MNKIELDTIPEQNILHKNIAKWGPWANYIAFVFTAVLR